jgi:hypothetical protein
LLARTPSHSSPEDKRLAGLKITIDNLLVPAQLDRAVTAAPIIAAIIIIARHPGQDDAA